MVFLLGCCCPTVRAPRNTASTTVEKASIFEESDPLVSGFKYVRTQSDIYMFMHLYSQGYKGFDNDRPTYYGRVTNLEVADPVTGKRSYEVTLKDGDKRYWPYEFISIGALNWWTPKN